MLSDSCLSPFPLSMARERSACYNRRNLHPPCYPPTHTFTPNPLAIPPSPFRVGAAVSTAATKTTNYCKTSQITLQLISSHCHPINKRHRETQNRETEHNIEPFPCFWHGKVKEGPLWCDSISYHFSKSQYLPLKIQYVKHNVCK